MTEAQPNPIKNLEIEVSISIRQRQGYADTDVLAESNRKHKGEVLEDHVSGVTDSMVEDAQHAVLAQFVLTMGQRALAAEEAKAGAEAKS